MHVLFFVEVEIGRAYPISRAKKCIFLYILLQKNEIHTNRQKAILLLVLKAHAPPPPQDAITNNKPY